MKRIDLKLHRNPFGRLVLHTADGTEHLGVTPVRTFPLAAPTEGLSIVSAEGRELAWIDHLDQLAPEVRALVDEELASRELTPVLQRLKSVSSFSTPSTWDVDTDRGPTQFVLKGEEDIRRLGDGALLITSGQGLQFRVVDRFALDRGSRKLLERFL